jgi:hypothetical protein
MGSVAVLVQLPEQFTVPAPQQTPDMHAPPEGHTVPHPPQLRGSF